MSKFFGLKDFVYEQGITMGEFKNLDVKTQELWRKKHQEKLKERLKERDESYEKHLFFNVFLPFKHVDPKTFDFLAKWKQEEWKKQFAKWLDIQKQPQGSYRNEDEYWNDFLADIGVPMGPDGPLGI